MTTKGKVGKVSRITAGCDWFDGQSDEVSSGNFSSYIEKSDFDEADGYTRLAAVAANPTFYSLHPLFRGYCY